MKSFTRIFLALLVFCCIAGVQSAMAATELEEIPLTKDMFKTWDGVGADAQPTGSGWWPDGSIFGNPNVYYLDYADLTGCDKLVCKGTPGITVRTIWNRLTDGGDKFEKRFTLDSDGNLEIDLLELQVELQSAEGFEECEYLHLNSIKLTSGEGTIESFTILRESPDEISLTKDMFKAWDKVGADAQPTGNGWWPDSNIFGDPNVSYLSYADLTGYLTGYDKLVCKGTPGIEVRTIWNRLTDGGSYFEKRFTLDSNGNLEINLQEFLVELQSKDGFEECEYLHLNSIKLTGNITGTIESFTILRELKVTDGQDLTARFKKYSRATYTRAFNTTYSYGTICLPFAPDAATCANYTFYKLDQANANTLMFVEETEPKANTAYLYCLKQGVEAEAAKILTGGKTEVSTEIETTVCGDWSFIGTLKTQTIDPTTGTFYAYKPDQNGGANKLSKATGTTMTVNPYRAYFQYYGIVAPATTMRMIIGGQGDGTTAIEEVITPDQIEGLTAPVIYDLMGRPVQNPQKGQIYIVNGQKVVY